MVGFARHLRPTYAEANVGHPSCSYPVRLRRRFRRDSLRHAFVHADLFSIGEALMRSRVFGMSRK
jgi:hypothetical protein